MHDVPGFDGTAPWAFRALARQQISAYPTITMTNGTVTAITPPSNSSNNSVLPRVFTIATLNGDTHCSRRVMLATGIRDILPNTPGIADLWGKVIYWCPWCDGWEHKDKPFGLISSFSTGAINSSITFAQTLNPGNVLLTNGTATAKAREEVGKSLPDWEARMKEWNVTLDDRVIEKFGPAPKPAPAIKNTGARKNKVRRADSPAIVNNKQESQHEEDEEGLEIFFSSTSSSDSENSTASKDSSSSSSSLALNAAKISPPIELSSTDLIHSTGLSTRIPDGDEAPKVSVDAHMQTSIQGIFAVGDMNSDGSTNVAHALWSAKGAVVYMHGELGRDYADEKAAAAAAAKMKMKQNGKKSKRDDDDGSSTQFTVIFRDAVDSLYNRALLAPSSSATTSKVKRAIENLWKRLSLPLSLTPREAFDSLQCGLLLVFQRLDCHRQEAEAQTEAEAQILEAEAEKWSLHLPPAGLEELKQRVRAREVQAREAAGGDGQEDPFAAAREMIAFMNE